MKATTAKTRAQFKTILFATDFSTAAAQALPYVKKIAEHFESNLVALHVRPPRRARRNRDGHLAR